jgi:hypothetical protein
MRSLLAALLAIVAVLLLSSCFERSPVAPEVQEPGLFGAISDAAHEGNPHFYWLPPIASREPIYAGTFDATLSPVVEICEWTGSGCVIPLLARFTTEDGPGSETVRVDTEEVDAEEEEEYYIVNWHTGEFALDPAKMYRISVRVGGWDWGFADVDVLGPGEKKKDVDADQYVPIENGRTLPIKFRIEQEARLLPGDPDAPAVEAIPDLNFVAQEEDYSDDHPQLGGVFVSFNVLILSFTLDATVGEANGILSSIDGEIVGGIPGVAGEVAGILFVRVPTTSHEELIALLDDLRAIDKVANVVQDALLEAELIPGANDGDPADWQWTLTPAGGNWGLELVRVPQMWNLNGGIERTTVTGVFDVGFADNHADLVYSENQTPGNQADHGTHVAGTIGATFNNGIGVDGINPFASLVVRAVNITFSDPSVLGIRQSFGEGFLNGFRDMVGSRDDISVVNISMGYNWGPAGVNQNTNAAAQQLVAEQGALFRTLLINLSRDSDLPLIVPAAGNDSNDGFGIQDARWGSPFNYAGLVLDPPDVSGASPIIVVESVRNDANATGGATRSDFSNTGGHISAPGSWIMSTSWPTLYESFRGTSMAAPHVTGLIGYLYALEPDLTHEQARTVLFSNAVAVDGGASNRIDAYASALDIDRVRGGTAVRLTLLDVDNDGVFDEDDIEAFRNAFDAYEPFDQNCSVPNADPADCPIHSRFDLNGTGIAGDESTSRFDLDRDGSYGSTSIIIEGEEAVFDQSALSDLDILCYYGYSSLFVGDPGARSDLLGSHCQQITVMILDEPVVVDVTVDLPDPVVGEIGADVMFNVDLSGSFADDLSTFQTRASEVITALQSSMTDLRVGITSLVDAPCSSFGDLSWGDYGHRLDLALTNDFDAFQATLDGLVTLNGADWPQDQLESMYQTMTGAGYVVDQGTACDDVADIEASTAGWSVERLRFLMHSTDATFHRPGDFGSGGVPYPYARTVSEVIETAEETGTIIFILDSGGGADAAKVTIAEATGGDVFLLDASSSQIVEAVEQAAQSAVTRATVQLVPEGDDAGFVQSIDPEVFTDIDLTTQSTVTFSVTFVNTVQPQPFEQIFRFDLVATVNGAILERRPVVVVIPAI